MYDVMGAITNSNIPVIYKGALVTKLILQESQFDEFVRETRDIDASWVGVTPPPMELLTEMLNRALTDLHLKAVAVREHGEKMSASYDIIDVPSNELSMSIDIDMRAVVDSRTYQFGNVTFQGVTSDNVLSDKIQDELRHSYDKLRRISAKPEFTVLYDYLANFLTPFIESKTIALVWNSSEKVWA